MRGLVHQLRRAFLCALLATAAGLAHGQAQAAARAPLPVEAFGPHSVPLNGAWEFHLGDDPAWASPAFDDSGWAQIQVGRAWEGQGYRNATGFAWYRRRLALAPSTLPAGKDWKLALLLPAVQDAGEVYWNGKLVGSYGKVPPHAEWYATPWPQMVVLGPADAQAAPACWRSGYGRRLTPTGARRIREGWSVRRCWEAPKRLQD